MSNIHSRSPYCDRPECIKQQRDELREQLARVTAERNDLSTLLTVAEKAMMTVSKERDELRRRIREGVVLRRGILVDKVKKDDEL